MDFLDSPPQDWQLRHVFGFHGEIAGNSVGERALHCWMPPSRWGDQLKVVGGKAVVEASSAMEGFEYEPGPPGQCP